MSLKRLSRFLVVLGTVVIMHRVLLEPLLLFVAAG